MRNRKAKVRVATQDNRSLIMAMATAVAVLAALLSLLAA